MCDRCPGWRHPITGTQALEGGLVAVVRTGGVPDVAAAARLGCGRAGRPGLVGRAAPEGAASDGAAVRLGARDGRGGVAQAGADLIDLELHGGALLAFLRLVGTLLETPGSDDPGTIG